MVNPYIYTHTFCKYIISKGNKVILCHCSFLPKAVFGTDENRKESKWPSENWKWKLISPIWNLRWKYKEWKIVMKISVDPTKKFSVHNWNENRVKIVKQ